MDLFCSRAGITIANLELLERGAEGSVGVVVCDFDFERSGFLVGVCTTMVESWSFSTIFPVVEVIFIRGLVD